MDRSTLTQQVESVERNVAFLQQEHRILLSGLRLEIRNLKKRCNGLQKKFEETYFSAQSKLIYITKIC
uniref:CCDC92/74 N-terminal domain-containing protein n=1 Tax=Sinocyclocheilus rhinocerous TaxID=307959 RepID=A0A673MC74_9TELE